MELFKLLPREVWDAQWVTTRDHPVCVVREEAVLKVLREYPLVICKRSLHLIEDNPLEDQGCLGVTRILMFQSPSLLPEIEFSQAGEKGRIQIHGQEIPEVLGVLCGKRV